MQKNDARHNNPFFRLNPETQELIDHPTDQEIEVGQVTETLLPDGSVQKQIGGVTQ